MEKLFQIDLISDEILKNLYLFQILELRDVFLDWRYGIDKYLSRCEIVLISRQFSSRGLAENLLTICRTMNLDYKTIIRNKAGLRWISMDRLKKELILFPNLKQLYLYSGFSRCLIEVLDFVATLSPNLTTLMFNFRDSVDENMDRKIWRKLLLNEDLPEDYQISMKSQKLGDVLNKFENLHTLILRQSLRDPEGIGEFSKCNFQLLNRIQHLYLAQNDWIERVGDLQNLKTLTFRCQRGFLMKNHTIRANEIVIRYHKTESDDLEHLKSGLKHLHEDCSYSYDEKYTDQDEDVPYMVNIF